MENKASIVERIKKKSSELAVLGGISLMALSLSSGVYLVGKNIYDEATADFRVIQSSEETEKRHPTFGSGSTLYYYDRNKDGKIDEIREHWVWYGAHACAPCERTYTPTDKEFKELNRILINKLEN